MVKERVVFANGIGGRWFSVVQGLTLGLCPVRGQHRELWLGWRSSASPANGTQHPTSPLRLEDLPVAR